MSTIRSYSNKYEDAIDMSVFNAGEEVSFTHYCITNLPEWASGSGSKVILKLKGAGRFKNICSATLMDENNLLIKTAYHIYIEPSGKEITIGIDTSEYSIPLNCTLNILVSIQ